MVTSSLVSKVAANNLSPEFFAPEILTSPFNGPFGLTLIYSLIYKSPK